MKILSNAFIKPDAKLKLTVNYGGLFLIICMVNTNKSVIALLLNTYPES